MDTKLLLALLLLFALSCKKKSPNDCSEAVCPAIYIAGPFLRFNFFDKANNEDLFFSATPRYAFADLVVFKKKNIVDTVHLPLNIDSSTSIKHFAVLANENPDSLLLQIQNQKVDTIRVTSKGISTNCCLSGYVFTSIRVNGQLICNDCAPLTFVDIKK
jgi:hypothetical protein